MGEAAARLQRRPPLGGAQHGWRPCSDVMKDLERGGCPRPRLPRPARKGAESQAPPPTPPAERPRGIVGMGESDPSCTLGSSMVTFLCFALKKFFSVKFFLTVLDDCRGAKGERARERFGPSRASSARELIRGPGGVFPACATWLSGGTWSTGMGRGRAERKWHRGGLC